MALDPLALIVARDRRGPVLVQLELQAAPIPGSEGQPRLVVLAERRRDGWSPVLVAEVQLGASGIPGPEPDLQSQPPLLVVQGDAGAPVCRRRQDHPRTTEVVLHDKPPRPDLGVDGFRRADLPGW